MGGIAYGGFALFGISAILFIVASVMTFVGQKSVVTDQTDEEDIRSQFPEVTTGN